MMKLVTELVILVQVNLLCCQERFADHSCMAATRKP